MTSIQQICYIYKYNPNLLARSLKKIDSNSIILIKINEYYSYSSSLYPKSNKNYIYTYKLIYQEKNANSDIMVSTIIVHLLTFEW